MLAAMGFWDHLVTFLTVGLPAIIAAWQSFRNGGKAEEIKAENVARHKELKTLLAGNAATHAQRADAGDARVDELEEDMHGKADKKAPPTSHKKGTP